MAAVCWTAQDNILNSIACHALARMAYIAPDLVLPIMHERFEVRFAQLLCLGSSVYQDVDDAVIAPSLTWPNLHNGCNVRLSRAELMNLTCITVPLR